MIFNIYCFRSVHVFLWFRLIYNFNQTHEYAGMCVCRRSRRRYGFWFMRDTGMRPIQIGMRIRIGLDWTGLHWLDCIQYGTINMEDDVCKRTRQEAQVNLAGGAGGEMTGLSPINKPSCRGRRHQSCGQGWGSLAQLRDGCSGIFHHFQIDTCWNLPRPIPSPHLYPHLVSLGMCMWYMRLLGVWGRHWPVMRRPNDWFAVRAGVKNYCWTLVADVVHHLQALMIGQWGWTRRGRRSRENIMNLA